jgi:hypothetical protein
LHATSRRSNRLAVHALKLPQPKISVRRESLFAACFQGFLPGLLFDPDDTGDLFFRNVSLS